MQIITFANHINIVASARSNLFIKAWGMIGFDRRAADFINKQPTCNKRLISYEFRLQAKPWPTGKQSVIRIAFA